MEINGENVEIVPKTGKGGVSRQKIKRRGVRGGCVLGPAL